MLHCLTGKLINFISIFVLQTANNTLIRFDKFLIIFNKLFSGFTPELAITHGHNSIKYIFWFAAHAWLVVKTNFTLSEWLYQKFWSRTGTLGFHSHKKLITIPETYGIVPNIFTCLSIIGTFVDTRIYNLWDHRWGKSK